MAFLDQEISFDIGHLVLLIALVGFIIFVTSRCRLSCGGQEGLAVGGSCTGGVNVDPVSWKSCRCKSCEEAVLEKARKGYLYGCNPNDPLVPYSKEECNYQYRQASLIGCGVP